MLTHLELSSFSSAVMRLTYVLRSESRPTHLISWLFSVSLIARRKMLE